MEEISLCTQIKDRYNFLIQALPTWLKHPFKEIVIFDWNSKKDLKEIRKEFKDPRIQLFKIESDFPFSLSQAKNISHSCSLCKKIVYVDCDVKIEIDFNKFLNIPEDTFLWGNYKLYNMPGLGCFMITRDQFEAINGYDERMIGYSYEDVDFHTRLLKAGYKRKNFPDSVNHIDHNDELRTRFFGEKDKIMGTLKNKMLSLRTPWTIEDRQKKFKVIKL